MKKSATIEQLASKINGKLWVKGDLKRIYLDEGYNTKKMSTKTYIYEVDGVFKVSCYIECPSQPYQWIKSQQNEIIERVEEMIDRAVTRIEKEFANPDKYNSLPYSKSVRDTDFATEILNKIREERNIELALQKKEVDRIEAVKTSIVFEQGGQKYSHPNFGIGTVISEDAQKITLLFDSVGEKKLLKRFAQLTKIA